MSETEPGRVSAPRKSRGGATRSSLASSVPMRGRSAATSRRFDATIEAFDENSDLAVLRVAGLDATPLAVGTFALGPAHAVVWSRDDGVRSIPIEVTKQLNITIEDIYVEDEVRRTGMELSGEISSGDSGGAVVNSDGEVVGIVYARSRARPGIAFATDSAELARLLRERPMDPVDRCF